MTRSRSGARRPRRPGRPPAATPPSPPAAERKASGWAQLSRGTKALTALVAAAAVTTVVPGVIPYLGDRAQDVLGVPLVDVDTEFGSSSQGLYLAAAEPIAVQPEEPRRDPRFVPAGRSATRLTVEGRRAAGVAVVDMTVEVVARGPVRTGTLYGIPSQGNGDNTAMEVDLDAPLPVATAWTAARPGSPASTPRSPGARPGSPS